MERTTRLFNNVSDELFNIKHKLNDLEYLNINNSLKDLYNLVCDKNNEDEDVVFKRGQTNVWKNLGGHLLLLLLSFSGEYK